MHRSPVRITGIGLLAIYLGLFLMQLDVSIVNVALNNIQINLGGGSSDRLPWIIDGYTLPIAVLMLTAGTLGDRVGHKRLYAGGLIIFFIGTVACAVAASLNVLIAARVLQGIGASSLAPSSLALLVRAFPEPYAQQRAVGRWAAIGGLGLVLGPFAGGALTSLFGWSAVFVVTAIAAAVALLATIHLHEHHAETTRPLDLPGIVTGSIVLAALVTAFIEGPHTGWSSAMTLASLAVFLVAVAAFVVIERRAPAPMLPLVVFRRPSFVAVNLAATLMTFGNIGFLFVFGLFLQREQGLSAFQAGLRMLPITIAL
ncbi:MAG: MFS transporter, partial [Thermomicrobiales bacterium]